MNENYIESSEEFVTLQKALIEQKQNLEKQVEDLTREYNRKTYIATGLAGLIATTNDAELIHKAAKIAEDADKASEEVIISNQ